MAGIEQAPPHWLSRDAIRRLVVSLIATAQAPRLRSGAIGSDQAITHVIAAQGVAACEDLLIDEPTLGCDSLALLEVILQVNRFFGLYASGVEDYLLAHPRLGTWCDLIDQHRDLTQGEVVLTFTTSGSTGTPKQVTFDLKTLVAEMQAHARGPFADQLPEGRIIALVPPHHIYGFLFTCLWPSLTGAAVVEAHLGVPTKALTLAQPGDLVIATPYIWELLGRSGQRFADDVRGVTSAGPSNEATWAVQNTTGLAKMTEVFGSTETAGLGTRTAADAPFDLLSHLSRSADDGIARAGTPLPLQDKLLWCGQTKFTVAGRLDDVIQVGGVNVSPAHVTCVLQGIPGVKDAVARPSGTGLRAFIVPAKDTPDNTAFQTHLRREITARLEAPARPTSLSFGAALPRNTLGKLIDWSDTANSSAII